MLEILAYIHGHFIQLFIATVISSIITVALGHTTIDLDWESWALNISVIVFRLFQVITLILISCLIISLILNIANYIKVM